MLSKFIRKIKQKIMNRLDFDKFHNWTYFKTGFVLVTITIIAVTFGWFVGGSVASIKGMLLSTGSQDTFELASLGTDGGMHKDFLEKLVSVGDAFTTDSESGTKTGSHPRIVWNVNETSNLNNNSGNAEGIQPGSSGSMSFYIIPLIDGEQTIRCKLSMDFYKSEDIIVDPVLKKLAAGHILFFESYEENTGYSGWIEPNDNNEMSFTITLAADTPKDTPIPVTFYWTWPNIMSQLIMKDGDMYLGGYKQTIKTDQQEEILAYSETNIGCFMYNIENSDNTFKNAGIDMKKWHDISHGTNKEDEIDQDRYLELSGYYNNADQKIGCDADKLVLYMTAQAAE